VLGIDIDLVDPARQDNENGNDAPTLFDDHVSRCRSTTVANQLITPSSVWTRGGMFGIATRPQPQHGHVPLAETTEERRRTGAATVIDSVRSITDLSRGLTDRRATDLLWLLNSPYVFIHLVRRAGWSPDLYQTWLADTMSTQLLSDS
jgi:hypothetical protein